MGSDSSQFGQLFFGGVDFVPELGGRHSNAQFVQSSELDPRCDRSRETDRQRRLRSPFGDHHYDLQRKAASFEAVASFHAGAALLL